MDAETGERWTSNEDFLAAKLTTTQAEMSAVILNRNRWEKLRDDYRMLLFLNARAAAADFQGVREELNRITDGRVRVPDLSGPRGKAADCLKLWATELQALDQPAAPVLSAERAVG